MQKATHEIEGSTSQTSVENIWSNWL